MAPTPRFMKPSAPTAIRLGRDPGPYRDIGTGFFVVADDPDAEWEKMGTYIAHEVRSYSEWSNSGDTIQNKFPPPDLAVLKSIGAYPILNPEDGLNYARERGANGDLSVHPADLRHAAGNRLGAAGDGSHGISYLGLNRRHDELALYRVPGAGRVFVRDNAGDGCAGEGA